MRTFALHGDDGTITGVVTAPDDAPAPMMSVAGCRFTEVVLPDNAALPEPGDAAAFRAFAAGFAVAPPEPLPLVARRDAI